MYQPVDMRRRAQSSSVLNRGRPGHEIPCGETSRFDLVPQHWHLQPSRRSTCCRSRVVQLGIKSLAVLYFALFCLQGLSTLIPCSTCVGPGTGLTRTSPGRNDAADTLNLYDVSGLAHFELFGAIASAGRHQRCPERRQVARSGICNSPHLRRIVCRVPDLEDGFHARGT